MAHGFSRFLRKPVYAISPGDLREVWEQYRDIIMEANFASDTPIHYKRTIINKSPTGKTARFNRLLYHLHKQIIAHAGGASSVSVCF